jgi:hypothetical protein
VVERNIGLGPSGRKVFYVLSLDSQEFEFERERGRERKRKRERERERERQRGRERGGGRVCIFFICCIFAYKFS